MGVGGGAHRGEGLGPAIAKIDQRRDRVGDRAVSGDDRRGATVSSVRAGRFGHHQSGGFILQFVDDPLGQFRADSVGAGQEGLVLAAMAVSTLSADKADKIDKAALAPTPWTVCSSRKQACSS